MEKRNKNKGNFLIRYLNSFVNACSGIVYAIKNEHNMIIMLLASVVAVLGGLYLDFGSKNESSLLK